MGSGSAKSPGGGLTPTSITGPHMAVTVFGCFESTASTRRRSGNLIWIVSFPPTPESRKGVALSLQINCFPIDGYGCWRFKPAGYPSVDCERHGLRSFNAKLDLAVLRIAGGLNDLDRNALYRDVRFRGNEQVYVNPVMTSEIDSKKIIRHILHQCS